MIIVFVIHENMVGDLHSESLTMENWPTVCYWKNLKPMFSSKICWHLNMRMVKITFIDLTKKRLMKSA